MLHTLLKPRLTSANALLVEAVTLGTQRLNARITPPTSRVLAVILDPREVNVLVASGMSVHERKDYGGAGGSTLHLKKGRLLVTVSVDHRAVHLLEVPACA